MFNFAFWKYIAIKKTGCDTQSSLFPSAKALVSQFIKM